MKSRLQLRQRKKANVSLHPKFLNPFLNKMTEYGVDQRNILPEDLANRFNENKGNLADLAELTENYNIDFNRYRVVREKDQTPNSPLLPMS